MSEDFIVSARLRDEQGKGASRRLRREGLVPGIVYGGGEEPARIALERNDLEQHLSHESFYSHILTIKIDGQGESSAVLKDLQRHPAKDFPIHIDFMRIVAGQEIRMNVPLHFMGEDECPGVKLNGGVVNHHIIDVEVACLPRNLPEYLEIDASQLDIDDSLHLSDIVLPEGVEIVALQHDDEDRTVVSVHIPRVVIEEEPTEDEDAEAAEGEEAEGEAEGDEDSSDGEGKDSEDKGD